MNDEMQSGFPSERFMSGDLGFLEGLSAQMDVHAAPVESIEQGIATLAMAEAAVHEAELRIEDEPVGILAEATDIVRAESAKLGELVLDGVILDHALRLDLTPLLVEGVTPWSDEVRSRAEDAYRRFMAQRDGEDPKHDEPS